MRKRGFSKSLLSSLLAVSVLPMTAMAAPIIHCPPESSIQMNNLGHVHATDQGREWSGSASMPMPWVISGTWRYAIEQYVYYMSRKNVLHCSYLSATHGIDIEMEHTGDADKTYTVKDGLFPSTPITLGSLPVCQRANINDCSFSEITSLLPPTLPIPDPITPP